MNGAGGSVSAPHPTLALSHLRFHLVCEHALRLPMHNKGTTLHGGFGNAFRKLVCVDLSWQCAGCSLRYTCPYTQGVQRLRDRVNALATFYGDGPLDLDFKALGQAAERIETVRRSHPLDRTQPCRAAAQRNPRPEGFRRFDRLSGRSDAIPAFAPHR